MSNMTVETAQPVAATQTPEPPSKPKKSTKVVKPRKKAKVSKKIATKSAAAKKTSKPAAERMNKKAEVIAMMRRPKGATLAEIMSATGWQKHTVRGFVSLLGKKGEAKIDSSKSAGGERTYKIEK